MARGDIERNKHCLNDVLETLPMLVTSELPTSLTDGPHPLEL